MTALGIIAILVLISQIFIQGALDNKAYDAKIINLAGKQRMLSQRISKTILLLDSPINLNRDLNSELNEALKEWASAHIILKNNLNSLPKSIKKKKLSSHFFEVDLEIKELFAISQKIKANLNFNNTKTITSNKKDTKIWTTAFLNKEAGFLLKMNKYVNEYESYASSKIKTIKKIEYVAFFFLIGLLFIEFFLLLRPAAARIKSTLRELIQVKDSAVNMAQKANIAVQQKRETLEELQLLQKAIDQNLLFARIDKEGHIITAGRRIKDLVIKQKNIDQRILYENLGLSLADQNELKERINSEKGALLNHEYKVTLKNSPIEWLDFSVFPVVKYQGIIEYIVVCLDITSRKKAQAKIDALNQEQIKVETASQKAKASMIVEAQEEERKRIAKDIHDSIGQMLTALKFNIESLDPKQLDKLSTKIDNLKVQTKDIILGVRMATFNLTPPELLDYGVTTAIQKMVLQLNKYSQTEIIFKNEIEQDIRFETLVETNLYRVTQECVNNAIKYAEADFILVTLKITEHLLSISITDNGNGFDKSQIPKAPKGGTEGGMGLFFMKERMDYINGRVFINSEPGKGTRVVLNYPIV